MTDISFKQIVKMWPTRATLASDICVKERAVDHWCDRNSIPAKYDAALLDAAAIRGIPLDARTLIDARDIRKRRGVVSSSQGTEQ